MKVKDECESKEEEEKKTWRKINDSTNKMWLKVSDEVMNIYSSSSRMKK